MGEDWYRFTVAGIDPGPLRAGGGVKVTVDGGLDDIAEAGLVVIPGWREIHSPVPTDLRLALREAYDRGASILTVCSGAFALAATGLLDGKRATTHWRYMPNFEQMYPKVKIERDVLYVDEGQLLTSAGCAAGIDLCLHLVRRDFGTKAVNTVARRLVVPPHRDGGQAQYVEQPVPSPYEGERLSSLLARMSKRLGEPLSIARLAREAKMSERTFIRRFQATSGGDYEPSIRSDVYNYAG